MRTFLFTAIVLLMPLRAEVVDRIVAVVDGRVITWSAALEEANYQAFAGEQEPIETLDEAALGKIVSRMIDQSLLEKEKGLSPFLPPSGEEPGRAVEDLRKRFVHPEEFQNALRRYRLNEPELLQRAERERSIMEFVDYRLRPQARVLPEMVESYYTETLAPELQRSGTGPVPSLSEVKDKIEQILTEREINRLLDDYLKQLRSHAIIKLYLSTRP